MNASILWSLAPQGSDEWHAARAGAVTGSIAATARGRSDGLTKQQRIYVNAMKVGYSDAAAMELASYKAKPKAAIIDTALAGDLPLVWGQPAILKARGLARQRVGGSEPDIYATSAVRLGREQEAVARQAYEDRTGYMVQEVGFAYTEDRRFGCSVDGVILRPTASRAMRLWECKTIVSSDTLFDSVIDGDISEWIDQCLFNMWLLTAEAIELYLHVWDLPQLSRVFVIERDEEAIAALEKDVVDFEQLVTANENRLLLALGYELPQDAQPATTPAAPTGDIAISNPPWGVAAPASTPNNAPAELANANF